MSEPAYAIHVLDTLKSSYHCSYNEAMVRGQTISRSRGFTKIDDRTIAFFDKEGSLKVLVQRE
ncbi:hypothetical protein PQC16_gp140 [Rhizobium phage RHph_TM30]|uniref:Uncharacterized protein n=1 Tax=Rhizobium phage RHph_TM30 TaxID=2509764 RepID=A0A7S5R510_9CAUD|nr:hypothetical protein PQC16_gp140 [Rhizobium phage RHph_TM30]QIG71247.1 hypothetical protein EVB93_140 [Rhizobium phage RHph_TM30]